MAAASAPLTSSATTYVARALWECVVAAIDPVITANGPDRDRLVVQPGTEDRPAATVFANRCLARYLPWSSKYCLAASSASLSG